jgi:hypothetical protein
MLYPHFYRLGGIVPPIVPTFLVGCSKILRDVFGRYDRLRGPGYLASSDVAGQNGMSRWRTSSPPSCTQRAPHCGAFCFLAFAFPIRSPAANRSGRAQCALVICLRSFQPRAHRLDVSLQPAIWRTTLRGAIWPFSTKIFAIHQSSEAGSPRLRLGTPAQAGLQAGHDSPRRGRVRISAARARRWTPMLH